MSPNAPASVQFHVPAATHLAQAASRGRASYSPRPKSRCCASLRTFTRPVLEPASDLRNSGSRDLANLRPLGADVDHRPGETGSQNDCDHQLGGSGGWMTVAAYQQAEMDRQQRKEDRDLHEQETSDDPDVAESLRASGV